MIYEFKGNKVSNSLSVFNYYKTLTGNSLERDIKKMKRLQDVMDNSEATEAEVDKAQAECDFDIITVIQYIYYAMRCAAEKKELDLSAVIDEIDISDLSDGKLQECIMRLVEVKKKDDFKAKTRMFLSRKR